MNDPTPPGGTDRVLRTADFVKGGTVYEVTLTERDMVEYENNLFVDHRKVALILGGGPTLFSKRAHKGKSVPSDYARSITKPKAVRRSSVDEWLATLEDEGLHDTASTTKGGPRTDAEA